MSFHQKGALKKHSTQTLEQVRTVMFFFPHVVMGVGGGRYAGLLSNQVKRTLQDYINELII